jgi:hypothetical protein
MEDPPLPDDVPKGDEKPPHAKEVCDIKDRRTKKGVLQYKVIYVGAKSDRGHWVAASELSCPGLVQKYEAGHTTSVQREKEVTEILGIVPNAPQPAYVVRFRNSLKQHIVTRPYLHKHFAPLLLDWYESHLQFCPKAEQPPKPRKTKKKGEDGGQPEAEQPPAGG